MFYDVYLHQGSQSMVRYSKITKIHFRYQVMLSGTPMERKNDENPCLTQLKTENVLRLNFLRLTSIFDVWI